MEQRRQASATAAPAPARVGPLRVWGIVRGRELASDGTLTLDDDAFALDPAPGSAHPFPRLVVRYGSVDGADERSEMLALYLAGGDVVELYAESGGATRLSAAAAEIARRACALPEFTQQLRGLGSQRARPGSDHDRFFGPLLAALHAAAAGAPRDQLRAFDPASLRDATAAALADFAAARFAASPPDRRALEAELHELAGPLWASLDALAAARERAERGPDDAAFLHWREWAGAVRRVYAAADRAWVAALPALVDSRGRQGRLWRRVLGRR